MTNTTPTEEVVWTPQMPDRRKNDRRGNTRDLQTNGKVLTISDSNDRRRGNDRRKKVTVTITGRAIDVEE